MRVSMDVDRVLVDSTRHDSAASHNFAKSKKSLKKSVYGESQRTMSESEFWKRIALKQQVLLHAKNKT